MPQLFAIVDEGGRTLLVKTQGDIQAPSFPTLGLLCSIASFGSSKGYVVQAFGTDNVQIVYQGFQNHLLFVLATSNKLVSQQLLQGLLQAVYAGIQLCVGRQALANVEMRGVDELKRHLRGMAWIEHLIAHDALFPCTMLPGPQWLGLAPDDKAILSAALASVSAAVPTPLSALALMREGLYLVATPGWMALTPLQQLLLQHLATHQGPKGDQDHAEVSVHVAVGSDTQDQQQRLVMVRVMEGATLLVLCGAGVTVASVLSAATLHAQKAQPILETPVWCALPVPQFSSVSFDLAAVVRLSPRQPSSPPPTPHVTLYWGYRRLAGATKFNPMSSPTVRKQMSSPASAASITRRALSSSSVTSSAEALQLFFKASCDLLAAFMLSNLPLLQPCALETDVCGGTAVKVPAPASPTTLAEATEASLGQFGDYTEGMLQPKLSGQSGISVPGSEITGTPRSAIAAFAQKFFSSFSTPRGSLRGSPRKGTASASASQAGLARATISPLQVQESQMLAEGKRLVAVVDLSSSQSSGVSVFLVCNSTTDRQTASQAARELRELCRPGKASWER